MKPTFRTIALALAVLPAVAVAAAPAPSGPSISKARIRADVLVLSSDPFGGRGPGEAAESKTIDYLIRRFKEAGLRPGAPGGGWTQTVPLQRFDRLPGARLIINGQDGGSALVVGEDVTLSSHAVGSGHVRDAPLVFAGYGVNQPGWNDFAGADLKGKVVLLLANDPDFEAAPDALVAGRFGGRALVYAGRLGVKVGAALAAGALGVLVVHEDAALSWPWRQAQNSDRLPSMAPAADPPAPPNSFNGLVRRDVAERLLKGAGLTLPALKAMAQQPGFKAVPLKMSVSADFAVTSKSVISRNVVARLEGRGRADEVVLFGAHWDANGKGAPDRSGDDIRNGAVDNATGTAELLEVARAFARAGPQARSVVFVAYTAEEKGLLGSDYYAAHPADPLERTAAVINLDPHIMLGRARNLEVVGPGQTDLEDDLAAAARSEGLRVDPEPSPEAGWYFRSDHYSFAKRGVPALSFRIGRDLVDGGLAAGVRRSAEYNTNRYHQTTDEFDPSWSFEGAAQEARIALHVGQALASTERWPLWRAGIAYGAARSPSDAARTPRDGTGSDRGTTRSPSAAAPASAQLAGGAKTGAAARPAAAPGVRGAPDA